MSKGFKYNFRKKIIQKAIIKNQRNVVFPVLTSIKTIGIVTSENVSTDIISKLNENVRLSCLKFIPRLRAKNEASEGVFINDVDFWGLPAREKISIFVNEPFDILINLMDAPSDESEYVCAKSAAKFKVSTTSNGMIYDLVISGITNNTEFIEEIRKTLYNFNKKN